MPDHLGVTVIRPDMADHRVVRVFRPGSSTIIAVRDALGKRFGRVDVSACGRVEGDQWISFALFEPSRILPVDDSGSGEDGSEFVRFQRVVELGPMHQIRTDSVAPGHVTPLNAVRIVLEEEVVFSLIENQPVRVVYPVFAWGEVDLGAVELVVRHEIEDQGKRMED